MSSSNDNSQPEQQNGHKKDRTQVRAEVMGLNQQRTALERELREFQEVLQSVSLNVSGLLNAKMFNMCSLFSKVLAWTIHLWTMKASLAMTSTSTRCEQLVIESFVS